MISYREHPIDYVDILVKRDMPVILVSGDCDGMVPYHENGKYLAEKYVQHPHFYQVIKPGCDHHPHGLADLTPLIAFASRYY